jgi:hypothetical protein
MSVAQIQETAGVDQDANPDPHRAPSLQSATIPLFSSIACAMIDRQRVPDGRLWLLLRWLDESGQGWVDVAAARRQFTGEDSPLRLCRSRQWRNLVARGEGVFWEQRNGRLWLRSATKVALSLGVNRVTGKAIALPVTRLLGAIGDVKAHFYASFHGGRQANPISRAAVAELTSVPPRSQLRYEKRARIRVRSQLALGGSATAVNREQQTWRHGRALFIFIDYRGQQGPPGRKYLAWRLPNCYDAAYRCYSTARTRRLNRTIDLVNKRAQGNDGARPERRYFVEAAAAAKAHNKQNNEKECYWPDRQEGIWHVFDSVETGKQRQK